MNVRISAAKADLITRRADAINAAKAAKFLALFDAYCPYPVPRVPEAAAEAYRMRQVKLLN